MSREENYIRTDFSFKLQCSECGTPLICDFQRSHFSSGGAQYANSIMVILPCKKCKENSDKPYKLMREAIKLLEERK